MKRDELIKNNPLRLLTPVAGGPVTGRHLGLVVAPAGTGKTAILVQIGLDKLFRGERVLHVGLDENLANIQLWYSEVFQAVVRHTELEKPSQLEDEVMSHRLIMTFIAESFVIESLTNKLDSLKQHDLPLPDCILLDGFTVLNDTELMATQLRHFAEEKNLTIWLSCSEKQEPCFELADIVLELEADAQGMAEITVIKDSAGYAQLGSSMRLNPQTLVLSRLA